jgi:centrin-1
MSRPRNPSRPNAAATSSTLKKDLTPAQRAEIREVFDLFDVDGTGHLEVAEIRVAMRALGLDVTGEPASLVSDASRIKDGKITYDTFFDSVADKLAGRDPREEIAKAFALFDDEGSGKITLSMLKRVAKELGETVTDSELEEMIQEASGAQDGTVTLQDFVRIMMSTNLYGGQSSV